jgi:hypothetical protein
MADYDQVIIKDWTVQLSVPRATNRHHHDRILHEVTMALEEWTERMQARGYLIETFDQY